MIEWIEKLPDSMIGVLASGALWFGFNYAVLAPRAMEKEHAVAVMPQCVQALDQHQARQRIAVPPVGRILGVPGLDEFQSSMIELAMPRLLTLPEKVDRCACAASRAARTIRLDYAVHTASFRLIEPQTVATFGDDAFGLVLDGVCGAIPQLRR